MLIWTYLILYLTFVYLGSTAKIGKTKRTLEGYSCPKGCTGCSHINGCVTCRRGLFLLLHRSGMRQTGKCTHACPVGYYGVRQRDFSKCYRCRMENCQVCFTKNYCTHCTPPYLEYGGQCIDKCPDGLLYGNYSRECLEDVECLVSTWSSWSHCVKNGQTCGYKYGSQTRTRAVLQLPSVNGKRCPATSESKKCTMEMRHCVDLSEGGPKPGKGRRHRGKKPYKRKRRRKCNKKRRKRNKPKCRRRKGRDRNRNKKRKQGSRTGTTPNTYKSIMKKQSPS